MRIGSSYRVLASQVRLCGELMQSVAACTEVPGLSRLRLRNASDAALSLAQKIEEERWRPTRAVADGGCDGAGRPTSREAMSGSPDLGNR